MYDSVESYGTNVVRDGVPWTLVETKKGKYDFSHSNVAYIEELTNLGGNPILVFQTKGPKFYNKGNTVYRDSEIEAFANYVVATLDHFDGIQRIEIGNEVNGGDTRFVSGAARGDNLDERAENYTRILKVVYEKVKAKHPDVEVIGGSTLEIPVGYMEFLRDHGAMEYMDGFSFHPYRSTEAEGVGAQIRYMQTVTGDLPLYATEFGKAYGAKKVDKVPGHMLKMISMMGDAGVEESIWYQLRDKESKSRALQTLDGVERPAADAFEFLNEVLLPQGNPVRLDTDAPIYLFRYGDDHYVVWGSTQAVTFTGDKLVFRDATGRKTDPVQKITDTPIIISGKNVGLTIANREVAGDSYYQFNLPNDPDLSPWTYFALDEKGTYLTAGIQGGQQRSNAGYTPYVASPDDSWGRYRSDHDRVQPGEDYAVVERFTVQEDGLYTIDAHWKVHKKSSDGVIVTVTVNGEKIYSTTINPQKKKNFDSKELRLKEGDVIDFVVDARASDLTDIVYRDIVIERRIDGGGETSLDFDSLGKFFTDDFTFGALEGGTGTAQPDVDTASLLELRAILDDMLKLQTRTFGIDDTLQGNRKDNDISGTNQSEQIRSGAGNDTIDGHGGHDLLLGLGDHDLLFGGNGRDWLEGGSGNDTLTGGQSDDVLIGGTGADIFRFTDIAVAGVDYIKDFNAAEGDRLDLSGYNLPSPLSVSVRVANFDGHSFVSIDADGAGTDQDFTVVAVIEGTLDQSVEELVATGVFIL